MVVACVQRQMWFSHEIWPSCYLWPSRWVYLWKHHGDAARMEMMTTEADCSNSRGQNKGQMPTWWQRRLLSSRRTTTGEDENSGLWIHKSSPVWENNLPVSKMSTTCSCQAHFRFLPVRRWSRGQTCITPLLAPYMLARWCKYSISYQ